MIESTRGDGAPAPLCNRGGDPLETTVPTPAEQLRRLPEPVQVELWRLVRLLAGMSQAEKIDLVGVVLGEAKPLLAWERTSLAAHTLSILVELVCATIDEAQPLVEGATAHA